MEKTFEEKESCPICKIEQTELFHNEKHIITRNFYLCRKCHFLFVPKSCQLSSEDEKKRYDLHHNDDDDDSYRQYLHGILQGFLQFIPTQALENKVHSRILDYGSGKSRIVENFFQKLGHDSLSYDLYFYPEHNPTVLYEKYGAQFSLITMIEVIEHLSDPVNSISELCKILKPGGYIGIHTKVWDEHNPNETKNWWYKNDPTHISLFTVSSLNALAQKSSLKLIGMKGNDLFLFQKKITLDSFLENRKHIHHPSFEALPKSTKCQKCEQSLKNCLCTLIEKFSTKVEIIILIHPMERKREKMGTGLLSHRTLQNSQLIMGINFDENTVVQEILHHPDNQCYILYPGTQNTINLTTEIPGRTTVDKLYSLKKNIKIFVIDGTWPCAKKMMKLSTSLHRIPRLSFTVQESSQFKIKAQPDQLCLSTIESIQILLRELMRIGVENDSLEQSIQSMLGPFLKMVEFQIQCAKDPNLPSYKNKVKRGYKNPSERTRSKKWESRKILFD